jgi:hypothetical protein
MPLSPSANHKSPFVISGAIAEMLPSTIKTAPIEMVKTKASQYGGQAAGKCCIDRSLCLRATGYHHRASALRPAKAYQAVLPHNSRLPRRFGRSCSINVSPYLRLSPHVKGGCFLSTPAARSHSRAGQELPFSAARPAWLTSPSRRRRSGTPCWRSLPGPAIRMMLWRGRMMGYRHSQRSRPVACERRHRIRFGRYWACGESRIGANRFPFASHFCGCREYFDLNG